MNADTTIAESTTNLDDATEDQLLAALRYRKNPKLQKQICELVNKLDDTKKLENIRHFIVEKDCTPRVDKKLKP